jgi:hypothetical protein
MISEKEDFGVLFSIKKEKEKEKVRIMGYKDLLDLKKKIINFFKLPGFLAYILSDFISLIDFSLFSKKRYLSIREPLNLQKESFTCIIDQSLFLTKH